MVGERKVVSYWVIRAVVSVFGWLDLVWFSESKVVQKPNRLHS